MVEIREVSEPQVQPGTVKVAVKAAGICGWDIEMWQHRMANPVTAPVIQGHEFCGVIEEIGTGVLGWNVGDRVVCETSAQVCGECRWCSSGDYQVCSERKGFGYGVDGAFASFVVVRQEILHSIPNHIGFEEAALTEPFCVGHHTMKDMVQIEKGDSVVVIGPGPIGLTCLQFAKLEESERTILIGIEGDKERMVLAQNQKWADHIIFADQVDAVSRVKELTDGEGADVIADCAGNTEALSTALESARCFGQIVKAGWGPEPYNKSLDVLLRKSLKLVGTFGHNRSNWEAVLQLISKGRLDVKPLITSVLPLSCWREAFQQVEERKAIKIVLKPDEEFKKNRI
ncbi:zinc-binding dehydrogenase [Acidobacteriota bacterium]